jgi:acetyl esterase/lipase
MASCGYAVISISYRLTMKELGFGCETKAKDKINAFNTVSKDISSAVNYLIKKKKKLQINTNKIVLIGSKCCCRNCVKFSTCAKAYSASQRL